jgi:hypothetical protein
MFPLNIEVKVVPWIFWIFCLLQEEKHRKQEVHILGWRIEPYFIPEEQ